MHMIRHEHVSPDRDAELTRASGSVLLKCLMRGLHIADLSAMKRADSDKEHGRIVGLKDSIQSRRASFDHLGGK
jgi:hypothetical protein